MREVWGKRGDDRESLGPPEWESSSSWQLSFPSTRHLPYSPAVPGVTQPRTGQAGSHRCPLWGWGVVRACMKTPSRGVGKG